MIGKIIFRIRIIKDENSYHLTLKSNRVILSILLSKESYNHIVYLQMNGQKIKSISIIMENTKKNQRIISFRISSQIFLVFQG